MSKQTVVVLGASAKPERFANKAIRLLLSHGHRVIPVHPKLGEIEGISVVADLAAIGEPVDTLTLYVGPRNVEPLIEDIIRLRPARVILNPGTESAALMKALSAADILYVQDCTLVMLGNGTFDI